MSTVVIHESDRLSAEAVAAYPASALHAVPRGAEIASAVPDARLLRLPNAKDPDFLDLLMPWLDRVLAQLDLPELELSRYRLLLELADPEHRRWVLQQVAAAGAAEVIAPHAPGALLARDLARQASALGLSLRWAKTGPRHAGVRAQVTEWVYPHYDHARRALDSVRRAHPTTHASVLFAESFPNSVHMLLPVEQAMLALGLPAPTWLPTRREVTAALGRAASPPLELESVLSAADFARAATPSWLALASLQAGLARLEPFCPAGAARLLHASTLSAPFSAALVEGHRWRVLAGAVLDRLKPRAVVSTSYSSVQGRAFAQAARARGIASIFVQHGSYPDRYVWSFFLHQHKLMWGDYARDSLLRHGHAAGSVHALGAPHYDAFAATAAKRPWSPPQGRPWRIAFMASRSGGVVLSADAARRTLRTVVEAAKALADTELVVKAHPGDATRIPEEETEGRPGVRLQRGGSSQDLILESDVIIVASSTTGFEACVAGRPLIELNLTGLAEAAEYAAAGAALAVREPARLVDTLRRLRTDPGSVTALLDKQRALLDRFLAGSDGHAAERVARFIGDQTGTRP